MANTNIIFPSLELKKYIYKILEWQFESIGQSFHDITQKHGEDVDNLQFEIDQLSRRIEKIEGKIK